MREYCKECGNHEKNCTCMQCKVCKKFFGLHNLYEFNGLEVCLPCLEKLENSSNLGAIK